MSVIEKLARLFSNGDTEDDRDQEAINALEHYVDKVEERVDLLQQKAAVIMHKGAATNGNR